MLFAPGWDLYWSAAFGVTMTLAIAVVGGVLLKLGIIISDRIEPRDPSLGTESSKAPNRESRN